MFLIRYYLGDLKYFWFTFPEDRKVIAVVALPWLIGSVLLLIFLEVMSLFGYEHLTPFYDKFYKEGGRNERDKLKRR